MVFLDISQNLQENTWPRPATLLKKRLWHKCFPVTFIKFLRTPILQNTSGRLLLKLLTSWQNSLDRSEFVGSILVDLLKAYDFLPRDLLLPKLQGNGFSKESIKSIFKLSNELHPNN